MGKLVAVVGDRTTKGGYIITGSGPATCGGRSIALVGDLVTCPKCRSKGQIVEGAPNFTFHGKPAAYHGCRVACKCTPVGSNQIIAGLSWMSVDVILPKPSESTRYVSNPETRSKIRIDVKKLLDLAKEVSEKHLYYEEIKQQFIQAIETFANSIVTQVDNGSISYAEGSEEIQKEKKSLLDQSILWLKNGLNVFGGVGMVMTGFALCDTGIGCVLGAPIMAHGINGTYEGSAGLYNGVMNQIDGGNRSLEVEGPLRKAYQSAVEALGFDASVGNIAYDAFDLGVSVHGKLKLVPKLNEFGNPIFKLFRYAKRDLEMAYKQMSLKLLSAEIFGDLFLGDNLFSEVVNAFILNKDTNQVIMTVREPEKITNVKQIVDECHLVITITGDDEDVPAYYVCKRNDNTEYRKDFEGNIIEGGIGQ
ncbi:PAAR domain-containing protein [Frischella perrara]|uniref:PAAR domain-containing protein n=1 Tax=Frischella perrara TaxID=1267021 RepID=UPI0023F38FEB|nr:PAAR domain-containing protein [Frischella perrara]